MRRAANAALQIVGKVRVVYAGCGVNALSVLQDFANSTYCRKYVGLISVAHQAVLSLLSVSRAANAALQIVGKVRVVYAGCGVNALSVLQDFANSTYCRKYVGLISVAHQAVLSLLSVSRAAKAALFYLVEINGTVLPGIMVSGSLPSQRSAVVRATSPGFSVSVKPMPSVTPAPCRLN